MARVEDGLKIIEHTDTVQEFENYLMDIDEYSSPKLVFSTLIALRDRHPRKRIMDVEKDFEGFYGGPKTPLKFFYFPRQSGGTPTTWNDCYVGMSLPAKVYARFKKAVEELGIEWSQKIYDIQDVRLKFDDKTRTVFIDVADHYTFVAHVVT